MLSHKLGTLFSPAKDVETLGRCSTKIGGAKVQVTGHRLQVTGHRSKK